VTAPDSEREELHLHLDAWEGPLDLLLNLARAQKVDLAEISILQLVEQYLGFIGEARVQRLELAADYLVIAAWLAFLDWLALEDFLPATDDPQLRRSALASSFVAALELSRSGRVDIAQDAPFEPVRVRAT
jgi:chromatin segregation and condensation protein Rec8/ScpA/Scc1 (kleisin family)